jgi:hypothetical protein
MNSEKIFKTCLRYWLAILVMVIVSSCGSGGLDSTQVPPANGPLQISPSSLSVFAGNTVTAQIQGGVAPFQVTVNDASAVTITSLNTRELSIRSSIVDSDTTVSITVQDSQRLQGTATLLIKPATIVNKVTVTPETGTDQAACGSAICVGLSALVTAELKLAQVSDVTGRTIKFDVIDGAYDFIANDVSAALTKSITVPVARDGKASVRIRVRSDAPSSTGLLRVTDLVSQNTFVSTFGIARVVSGQGVLTAFPDSATYKGEFDDECAKGIGSTFYVYGGAPPYTLQSTLNSQLQLSVPSVLASGGGFSTVLSGVCFDRGTALVTDTNGRAITINLSNVFGTKKRPVTPVSSVAIKLDPQPRRLGCGEVSSHLVIGGGQRLSDGTTTPPQFRAISGQPSLVQAVISAGTLSIGRAAVGGTSAADITVDLSLTDGFQTITIPVPVAGKCP